MGFVKLRPDNLSDNAGTASVRTESPKQKKKTKLVEKLIA